MAATYFDLTIEQGRTLEQVVCWESEPFVFAEIASISNSAPVQIVTTAPHGLPDGWRVAVVAAKGLASLNASKNPPVAADFRRAIVRSATSIEFNPISTASDPAYTSGGYIQWYTPVSLSACIARLQVKTKAGGETLLSLTTTNGGILLDDVLKTITLKLSATASSLLTFTKGVYDLEIEDAAGVVTSVLTGAVKVVKEITT